jgi:predicted CXXCH cytochrome family protein
LSVAATLLAGGWIAFHAPALAQTQIARTKHNLTASGPGTVRTAEAAGTCVFCHTPHNANPTRGLWNRDLPAVTYQLYASSTLQAQLDQPTGSTRLCLSCHDGLLAVGNLRVAPKGAPLAIGPLTGKSSLGTNLSGDHPVSFLYDAALALRRGDLADPLAMPHAIRLDDKQQMQCTSCHDPHDDRQPKFLRMDNRSGALCTACHRPRNWSGSSHATSTAVWNGSGTNPLPDGAPAGVAENACSACHRSHAAAHPQRLLAQSDEPANCTVCHAGNVAGKNIEAEFLKPLHHPIEVNQWTHEPRENPLAMPRHVACADCHNPHAANATARPAPAASGRLQGVSGVTLAGMPVAEASFEYEVCFKCHALREPATIGITRQGATRNIRLKIDPANRSYHPIVTTGANTSLLGLEPGSSAASLVSCTSCHNNDEWTATGAAPAGPHGSRFEPILERQYETGDPTAESSQSFDLCYKCHNRGFLINDRAATFPHKRHVVGQNTPCAACHDAHGSRQNTHLIDFMLRDRTGKPVVTASSVQGRLEYISVGAGRGQCYLQCHGVNHEPKSYP